MSNDYSLPLNRIDLYFTIIPWDGIEPLKSNISISKIASEYNIPVSIIRSDFIAIISAYKKDNEFLVLYPIDKDFDSEFMTVDSCITQIQKGEWDNKFLVTSIPINQDDHSIFLTPEEQKALNEEFQFDAGFVDFDIKNSFKYQKAPNDLFAVLSQLNIAISDNHQIFFAYLSGKSQKLTYVQTSPVKIIYDNEENLYHLLAIKNKNYVTYDIKLIQTTSVKELPEGLALLDSSVSSKHTAKVHILNMPCVAYDSFALEQKIPHVWKNAFSEKNPTHVRIKFSEHVYDSVYADLYYRNPDTILSAVHNGYFFFEDDIYGLDAFDNWIRTYGSKAVILEPKSLAEKRIASLKQNLENYNKFSN